MSRWIATIVLFAVASLAHAQPLAPHVPAEAQVYVGWAGVDELGEQYTGSKLKAVLDAAQFGQLINETIPTLLLQQAGEDPSAAEAAELFRTLGPVLWHRPVAVYFAGMDSTPDGEAFARCGVICSAGEYQQIVTEQLERLRDVILEEQDGLPVQVQTTGDVVGLYIGAPAQAGQGFTQRMPADSAIALFVDAERIMGTIDALIAEESEEDLAQWHAVRDALGLDGVKRFVYAAGFEGKSWRCEAFLDAPAPRRGLVAALEGKPLDDAQLKIVPQSATWLQVSQLDIAAVYDAILESVIASNPQAMIAWQQKLAALTRDTGVDLDELIRQFGPTWIMYNDPAVSGTMGLGLSIVNRPAETAALEAQLSTLEDFANAQLEKQQRVPFRFKRIPSDGMTIHSLAVPMFSPSWAVRNGNLYITLFPQAIVMADLYAQQSGPSILDNEKFLAVRKRALGGAAEPATSLTYVDLPQTAPQSYQGYMMLTQTVAAMMPAEAAPDMLLPPLGLILPHLEPAGSAGWADEAGFHCRGVSPFPGSSLLSQNATLFSNGGVVVPAVGVGILLPALGAARRTAREMQSATQARGIQGACIIYAQSHDEQYPDELYPLYDGKYVALEYVVSPMSGVTPPRDFDQWEPLDQRNWLRQNASYVIVPGKTNTIDAREIQVVGKPSHHSDRGMPVVYGDNHTKWELDVEAVSDTLYEQTGQTLDELIFASEQPVESMEDLEAAESDEAVSPEDSTQDALEVSPAE
jgi:hypothetical protein